MYDSPYNKRQHQIVIEVKPIPEKMIEITKLVKKIVSNCGKEVQ